MKSDGVSCITVIPGICLMCGVSGNSTSSSDDGLQRMELWTMTKEAPDSSAKQTSIINGSNVGGDDT